MSGELRFLEVDDEPEPVDVDPPEATRAGTRLVLVAVGALAVFLLLGLWRDQGVPGELTPVAADLEDLPADLPPVELALADSSGLRIVELRSGQVTWLGRQTLEGAPLVVSVSGALVGTGATTFYPWDGSGANRVGPGRPIALAGPGRAWLVDWEGSSLLTASLVTFDGEVIAERDIGREGIDGLFAALFGPGYHPLLNEGRSVLELRDDGSTGVVTSGELVATGVNHVVYRQCGADQSCRSAIIDLASGTERPVPGDLVGDVRPASSAISADGRWLAVLDVDPTESLQVIDLQSGDDVRVVTSINLPGPGSLSWTTDSRWIFVAGRRATTALDVDERQAYLLDLGTGPNARLAIIDR